MTYFNKQFPTRRFYRYSRKRWVKDEIKLSSARLHDLYILSEKYPSLKFLFTDFERKHSELINDTKTKFFQEKIMHSTNPTESCWNIVNTMKNKIFKNNMSFIRENDVLMDEPVSAANKFNIFFRDAPANVIIQIPKLD
ncbi:hypothetical protein WA026_001802 [Henosepilachna vigintioctopunctata]|uniref:Uncharacterized protein n=1 Tax=Henosepilachna vigintioctopunctata TaxID=420089 RepID=A0AAW1UJ43_9CUCU